MGATAPPPTTSARIDPEICVNLMRNMPVEIWGWGAPAFGRIRFRLYSTVYNMGIIYTFLCLAVMNYGTDS